MIFTPLGWKLALPTDAASRSAQLVWAPLARPGGFFESFFVGVNPFFVESFFGSDESIFGAFVLIHFWRGRIHFWS
jgi:hypothetical protein